MPSGDYPRTVAALFRRAFATNGDRPAVSDARRTLSYRDLADHSRRLAAALRERGVGRADRVAILLPNRVEVPVVDVAVLEAGGVRLPLNPMQSRDELAYVFEDADVHTVVCGSEQVETVDAVAGDLDGRIVVGGTAEGYVSYKNLVREDPPDPALPAGDPDALAGHYYTGGTTGRPKGVHYSNRCLVASLVSHLGEFGFDDTDVGVLAPPLSHSAGTFLWTSLLAGGRVHIQDGFDAARLLSTIDRESATWTFLVPTMLYRLLDSDALDDADLDALEHVLYGAAPARPDRIQEAVERLGPVFEQFYGQTEVPNLITTLSRSAHRQAVEQENLDRLASAGTPCLRSSVRIVADDAREGPHPGDDDAEGSGAPAHGEDLSPGAVGEVVVAAPYAFDGYHEAPEATAATLRDGWVWTGDVGYLDDDGYLYLLDRKGDVIVSGGMNVYSAEVERVLADHPGVADVLVVGIPDDDWGEAVHAVVVPAGTAEADADSVSEADLRAFADDRLAAYKKPKSVEFVDDLPTTPLGKLDRSALRDEYWADEDRRVG